jgi:hypothetical protein
MTGNCARAELTIFCWSSGLFPTTKPSTVTKTSRSGKSEKKP